MTKNDDALFSVGDVLLALALLSRLPVNVTDTSRGPQAAWAYPIVGLVVSGLAALAGCCAYWVGLPIPIVALMSLLVLIISTGAMHEDGLADCADGVWGGWTTVRRLSIMKDSHIGTYGVIGLFISLAARWVGLTYLFQYGVDQAIAGLLIMGICSRATMPVLMAILPHAREDGLSKSVGKVSKRTAMAGVVIASIATLLLSGLTVFPIFIVSCAVTFAVAAIARAKIGGQTGDVLGASQQLTEIAILLVLIA